MIPDIGWKAFAGAFGRAFYSMIPSGLIKLLSLPASDSTGLLNLGDWTDTRAVNLAVLDFESISRDIPALIVPYEKARIAENLKAGGDPLDFDTGYTKSDLSVSSGFDDPFGGTNASKLTIVDATNSLDKWNMTGYVLTSEFINSCYIRAVSGAVAGQLRAPNGASHRSFSVSESWERIATTVTNPHASGWLQEGFFNIDGDLLVYFFQSEEVTGQAIQSPSELTTGFNYYITENGNTVDGSGVVTEVVGSALSPVPELLGYTSVAGNVRHPLESNFNQSEGVLRVKITPTFAQTALTITDEGIVSVQDSATSLLFMDSAGLKSTDGTNTATVNPSFVADVEIEIAVRWSTALNELQVGYSDGTWVWGSAVSYDGGFTLGTYINSYYGLTTANSTTGLCDIYNTDMTTGQVEALP